jgi:hypothetical protein
MARKRTPANLEEAVLMNCRRRCALCFALNRDTAIKQGQIAHVDRDASNAALDNLVFLCLPHHDDYDSRRSQSKGITPEELGHFRRELEEAIREAWRQPVEFGGTVVRPPDEFSGHWVRDGENDSSEIDIDRFPNGRVRIKGFALHGKTWDIGPNFGQLDFEAPLDARVITFVDPRLGGDAYQIELRFKGATLVVTEEHAFGYFGAGAHFAGEYVRP